MGAVVGPNLGLSELGSLIVRKVAENADAGFVAKSTEEVIHKFEEFNKGRIEKFPGLKKLIISSMDIEKFYPNILSEESAKIVRQMWEESDIPMDGIDMDYLSKYLGMKLSKTEIAEEKFEDLVYTKKVTERKKKTKITKKISKRNYRKKPKLRTTKMKKDTEYQDIKCSEGADTLEATTNSTSEEKVVNDNSGGADTSTIVKKKTKKTEWIKAKKKPSETEGRKMFGKALEIMLRKCMDNHLYLFENKVRLQTKGGPIGLKLTGEIADCVMIHWDKILLKKLKSLEMEPKIYTRFKDDIQIVIESLENGSKIEDGKVVVDEQKKLVDKDRSNSKVTMDVIQEVANSINPMIKLTVETPCNFKD